MYGDEVYPRFFNGRSAAKSRIGKRSTTRAYARRTASDWQFEIVNYVVNNSTERWKKYDRHGTKNRNRME